MNPRLSIRNIQDAVFKIKIVARVVLLLVFILWVLYRITSPYSMFPEAVVQNGSNYSSSDSNKRPGSDLAEFLTLFPEKKQSLEENVGNTLLHGEADGVNKIDEKGVMTKMEASIQTEPDKSKLNDGTYSFSDENRIPQHVCHKYRFCDENGILQHVRVNKIDEKGAPTKMKADIIFRVNKLEKKKSENRLYISPQIRWYAGDYENARLFMEDIRIEFGRATKLLDEIWVLLDGKEELRMTGFAAMSIDYLLLKDPSQLIEEHVNIRLLGRLIRHTQKLLKKLRAGLHNMDPALKEPLELYMSLKEAAADLEGLLMRYEELYLDLVEDVTTLVHRVKEKGLQIDMNVTRPDQSQPEKQHSILSCEL